MRRLLPFAVAAAVLAAVVVGLTQTASPEAPQARYDLQAARAELRGAPAPLAALHAQSAELVEQTAQARLAELKGHPVVVNKWASWCGPCRAEFPIFQKVSTDLGREVAFLGLNSGDNRDDAQAFLREYPVPWPSLRDPDEKIARSIGMPASYPMTAFFDASGKRTFVHQGQYRSEADLLSDIERYAR